MKRPYSDIEKPPALLMSISVGKIEGPLLFTVDAKLDTGAFMSALPQQLLENFGITPTGSCRARGAFDRVAEKRPTYRVRIQLGAGPVLDLKVLAQPNPRRLALIGRDVLNECMLVADGPREMFDLSFGRIDI